MGLGTLLIEILRWRGLGEGVVTDDARCFSVIRGGVSVECWNAEWARLGKLEIELLSSLLVSIEIGVFKSSVNLVLIEK